MLFLNIYILFLDNPEWIESNPAQLCTHLKSIYNFFSSKNNNNYEVDLTGVHSSIVLQMRWNATQAKKLKTDCKIKITTKNFHRNSGIYINILKMKLRQYRSSEKCIDSLQIKYNGNIKQTVCGTLQAGKIKSFEDLAGTVKLTLKIDTGIPFDRNDDFIELQVVATAFKECSDDMEKDNLFNCKNNHYKSCISKSFVNDTIVNCAEPTCADEGLLGCASTSIYASDSYEDSSSNENVVQIFLSAVTSLILTILTLGCLVWIIYKIKKCVAPSQLQTSIASTSSRHGRRRRNQNTNNSSISHEPSPSAPPLDKDDLPPSYSELFGNSAKQESSVETS